MEGSGTNDVSESTTDIDNIGNDDSNEQENENKHELLFKTEDSFTCEEGSQNWKYPDMSVRLVWFNVIMFSFSFLLLFSAFLSFSNLQSTINQSEGLGTIGITVIYISLILTCIFCIPLTMTRFSLKWISVVSMVTYLGYLATGYYSSWATIIPASVLVGFGAAHLWTANPAFLTQMATIYATKTKQDLKDTLNHFSGVFFFAFCSTHVWGNLYSSLVLQTDQPNTTVTADRECGADFCPYEQSNTTTIIRPTTDQINKFTTICMAFAIASALCLAVFIKNKPLEKNRSHENISSSVKAIFIHLFKDRRQHFLFITNIYRGVTQGFIIGDFTIAFVSCPLGVEKVGFVMMVYGVTSAVFSYIYGKISKYTGLYPLFCLAFVIHTSVCIVLLLWRPTGSKPIIIYIIVGLWSIADPVYLSILTVIYSLYFKEKFEAALSCFRLLDSVGLAITFSYSAFLCTRYKIYIVQTMLVLSQISITVFFIKFGKMKCLGR